jgi:hypothetical protein
MGRWLENTVTTEVQASADKVWAVWSDLEAMPKWMRWIESVKTQKDDPDLTDWILAAQGFRFTWKARITQRVEEQQLHWASVRWAAHQGCCALLSPNAGLHCCEAQRELRTAQGLGTVDGSKHLGGDCDEGASGEP